MFQTISLYFPVFMLKRRYNRIYSYFILFWRVPIFHCISSNFITFLCLVSFRYYLFTYYHFDTMPPYITVFCSNNFHCMTLKRQCIFTPCLFRFY
nr:MAG TPA: hypothetical protein [Caudoviricetes sp.]